MTVAPDAAAGGSGAHEPPGRGVRWLVLVSAAFLVLQVSWTDYGMGSSAVGAFWLVLGLVLLWWVYRRRSRVARGTVVVLALAGAVVYGLGALDSTRAALLAVAHLGQALPLLTRPVQRHVQGNVQGNVQGQLQRHESDGR